MSDIVERAREAASRGYFYTHNSLVYELIDEIERLRAETDPYVQLRLEAEIERLQAENQDAWSECKKRDEAERRSWTEGERYRQSLSKAEAEIERLQAHILAHSMTDAGA